MDFFRDLQDELSNDDGYLTAETLEETLQQLEDYRHHADSLSVKIYSELKKSIKSLNSKDLLTEKEIQDLESFLNQKDLQPQLENLKYNLDRLDIANRDDTNAYLTYQELEAMTTPSKLLSDYKTWNQSIDITRVLKRIRRMVDRENWDKYHPDDYKMIDYLIKFSNEIAPICKVTPDGTIEYELEGTLDQSSKFTEKYTTNLLAIANYICEKEFEKGLERAHRMWDNDSKTWSLEIPDFLTAIYTSLYIEMKALSLGGVYTYTCKCKSCGKNFLSINIENQKDIAMICAKEMLEEKERNWRKKLEEKAQPILQLI